MIISYATPPLLFCLRSRCQASTTAAEESRCETTYQCCKLSVPRRHLRIRRPRWRGPGRRFQSRLIRRIELRENNHNWRRESLCLKWCPVQRHDCTIDELPTPYEPPQARSGVHNGDGEEVDQKFGLSGVVEEVPSDAVTEEPTDVDEGAASEAQGGDDETPPKEETILGEEEDTIPEGDQAVESEIIDVPIGQQPVFGNRAMIKVPCFGSSKPDRSGICRSAW